MVHCPPHYSLTFPFPNHVLSIVTEELFFGQTAWGGSLQPLPSGLEQFDCSYSNILGGLVDENFQTAPNLNYVFLSGATFDTTVPPIFGQLTNLEFLYLSEAFIRGDLSYMEGMPKIFEHWIDINPDLGGRLPTFLGNLFFLESFSVTASQLTGPIPSELGNLESMRQMWFYENRLTGQIPTELGNLRALKLLQIQDNNLAGGIPDELCARVSNPFNPLDQLGADCSTLSVSVVSSIIWILVKFFELCCYRHIFFVF